MIEPKFSLKLGAKFSVLLLIYQADFSSAARVIMRRLIGLSLMAPYVFLCQKWRIAALANAESAALRELRKAGDEVFRALGYWVVAPAAGVSGGF